MYLDNICPWGLRVLLLNEVQGEWVQRVAIFRVDTASRRFGNSARKFIFRPAHFKFTVETNSSVLSR
jgi:hypothetical protein